jgi:hypothetical protein
MRTNRGSTFGEVNSTHVDAGRGLRRVECFDESVRSVLQGELTSQGRLPTRPRRAVVLFRHDLRRGQGIQIRMADSSASSQGAT